MYMIQKLHTPFLDEVMKGITFLGESGWFWILVAVLLFCQKRTRKIGLAVALSLAVGLLLGNIILKPLIAQAAALLAGRVHSPADRQSEGFFVSVRTHAGQL